MDDDTRANNRARRSRKAVSARSPPRVARFFVWPRRARSRSRRGAIVSAIVSAAQSATRKSTLAFSVRIRAVPARGFPSGGEEAATAPTRSTRRRFRPASSTRTSPQCAPAASRRGPRRATSRRTTRQSTPSTSPSTPPNTRRTLNRRRLASRRDEAVGEAGEDAEDAMDVDEPIAEGNTNSGDQQDAPSPDDDASADDVAKDARSRRRRETSPQARSPSRGRGAAAAAATRARPRRWLRRGARRGAARAPEALASQGPLAWGFRSGLPRCCVLAQGAGVVLRLRGGPAGRRRARDVQGGVRRRRRGSAGPVRRLREGAAHRARERRARLGRGRAPGRRLREEREEEEPEDPEAPLETERSRLRDRRSFPRTGANDGRPEKRRGPGRPKGAGF